jgi:hypothetical protein
MDAVAMAEDASPSEALYVKVRTPVNDPPDLNVKLPLAESDNDPFPLPSTRMTVRPSPSAS